MNEPPLKNLTKPELSDTFISESGEQLNPEQATAYNEAHKKKVQGMFDTLCFDSDLENKLIVLDFLDIPNNFNALSQDAIKKLPEAKKLPEIIDYYLAALIGDRPLIEKYKYLNRLGKMDLKNILTTQQKELLTGAIENMEEALDEADDLSPTPEMPYGLGAVKAILEDILYELKV